MEDLELLTGKSDRLNIGDQVFIIRRFRVMDLPHVSKFMNNLKLDQSDLGIETGVFKLMLDNFDPFIDLLAHLTDKTRKDFEKMSVDDLTALATSILEKNQDFFKKKAINLSRLMTGQI